MFDSAKLKIERAKHHIGTLEAEFAAYVATKPHRFLVYHDPETRQPIVRIRFVNDPPQNLSLIIGDAIHNIRAALDHLTWEVVGLDNGTQDRYLSLVTGDNRVRYEAACKGIKTPSDWVKDLFISLEIFPGGKGDSLYALTALDNADKHTVLTPVVRATSHPTFTILNPDGTPGIRMEGNIFIGGITEHTNIVNILPGHSLEINDDTECAPSIFFQQVNGPSEPIIPTLEQYVDLTLEIIQTFEIAFP